MNCWIDGGDCSEVFPKGLGIVDSGVCEHCSKPQQNGEKLEDFLLAILRGKEEWFERYCHINLENQEYFCHHAEDISETIFVLIKFLEERIEKFKNDVDEIVSIPALKKLFEENELTLQMAFEKYEIESLKDTFYLEEDLEKTEFSSFIIYQKFQKRFKSLLHGMKTGHLEDLKIFVDTLEGCEK